MDCGSIESMIAVLNELCPEDTVIRIPELVISRIMCQVLNGMHYLHGTLNQIHRDVKPDNILISS